MELIIFITSAGPNVNFYNVEDTIKSFSRTLKNNEYGFYYVVDNPTSEAIINKIFKKLNLSSKLIEVVQSTKSWAINYNLFIDKYKDKTKYFAISHDDLIVNGDNFLEKTKNIVESATTKIGWITYTSDGYYKQFGIPMTNSVREGFVLDRANSPQTFECHKFNKNDKFIPEKIDLPLKPVKIHGPFSHLVLVQNESMKEIGYCSDWSEYTLLIDEDWALESLKKNYSNIWIPDISYTHPLRYNQRAVQGIRYESEVHEKFKNKWEWDFKRGDYTDEFIDYAKKKYKGTNVTYTADKLSYDWQYL